jgi:hypothetical protein
MISCSLLSVMPKAAKSKIAGGKRQLLKDLTPLLPGRITTYSEPFVGGILQCI